MNTFVWSVAISSNPTFAIPDLATPKLLKNEITLDKIARTCKKNFFQFVVFFSCATPF